jgi:5-methylcytosine-specific restriction endonuclease McrA
VQKHCSHECARGISIPKGSNRENLTKSLKAKARWGRINPLKVLEKDGWRCYICFDPTPPELRGSYDNKAPECDHVVPLTRGGSHSYDNMRCARRQCNRRKGNKLLSEMAA